MPSILDHQLGLKDFLSGHPSYMKGIQLRCRVPDGGTETCTLNHKRLTVLSTHPSRAQMANVSPEAVVSTEGAPPVALTYTEIMPLGPSVDRAAMNQDTQNPSRDMYMHVHVTHLHLFDICSCISICKFNFASAFIGSMHVDTHTRMCTHADTHTEIGTQIRR